MALIAIVCLGIAVGIMVFGVIIPFRNMRKCTEIVNGTVSNIKDVGPDEGNPQYSGTVTYYYGGKSIKGKWGWDIGKYPRFIS